MQYQVPQFIDLDPKILGPLTFKQALYLGIAAGTIFVLYFLNLNFYIFLTASALIAIFAMALAFIKINNQSFLHILGSMFLFILGSKVFIWKQEAMKKPPLFPKEEKETKLVMPESPISIKKGISRIKRMAQKIDLSA